MSYGRIFAVCSLVAATSSTTLARELPDFGLMLNDDGDFSFVGVTPQRSVEDLQAHVGALAGTVVKTLTYGAGVDVVYYPTEIGSVWRWRDTPLDTPVENPKNENEMWHQRISKIVDGLAAGIDPIRVAGEKAKSLGMYFMPSYRMNDDHFIFDPFESPLTGEFWIENHETMTIKDSPILSDDHYGNLLDFSHKEVREYRLGIIFEMIDRYQDIMDGFELDFNRSQVLFPRGKGPERAPLITDMVRQIRKKLNKLGKTNGREYYLLVRVPPSLKNCMWAGMDIAAWMDQKLVDVLIPAQLMTLAHDMPIHEFVALAEPAGAQVYPAIYPRTIYRWPLLANPTPANFKSTAAREVTSALVRGAAANYWDMGASGFQLFNFHHEDWGVRPYTDRVYRIFRDLASPQSLVLADKVYAVTPGFYLDHEDTYQYRKQIPTSINVGSSTRMTFPVGEDYSDPSAATYPDKTVLMIGFNDLPQKAKISISLNGSKIYDGPTADHLIDPDGVAPVTSAAKSASLLFQIPIDKPALLVQGENVLEVSIDTSKVKSGAAVEIAQCEVGVFYDRKYLKMLFEL
ncbi:hypothetical protein [Poriferisphaera sp. WC338]|uniref:hypothetical protein n=1 Tax=Poriferisphaera sp. WC338 TaxID=3425129 RepID=UPI003D81907A